MSACLLTVRADATVVVDFDQLDGYTVNEGDGSYFDGHGIGASTGTWSVDGVTFNTAQFGPGWSYSNVNDTTTAGFTNQFAAITGTDVSGSGNYVIGNSSALFNLAGPTRINSVAVTNATYSALSMRDGDQFAKQFGGPSGDDPDFLRVTFTGYSGADRGGAVTGTREFFLADYRFGDNSLDYIIDDWNLLDLSSLGIVQSVGIGFDGSDVGSFGLNTPTYVAIDNLSITAIPEPGSFALLGAAGIVLTLRRRRRKESECFVRTCPSD